MTNTTKLKGVSRARPCPVCGGDHKCSVGTDGVILCGRRQGPRPGFVDLGPCQGDPTWNIYRHEGDPRQDDRAPGPIPGGSVLSGRAAGGGRATPGNPAGNHPPAEPATD